MNEEWLSALKAMGKGPLTLYAARHTTYSRTFDIEGEFVGSTLQGQIRLHPDAASSLVSFTVSGPTIAGGTTSFTISLTEDQIEALPEADPAAGFAELTYDLHFAADGVRQLLIGGPFIVVQGVTDV